MLTVAAVATFLDEFSPRRLAAEWDNVGLLVGDASRAVRKIMTCLTVTPKSAAEAVAEKADLIVTHHPLLFRPVKKLTAHSIEGRILLELIEARIAVFSSHTAFDSARAGINQSLAEGLKLVNIKPLEADADDTAIGTGRIGQAGDAATLSDIAARLKAFLGLPGVHVVGDPQMKTRSVAVACGSAGELLDAGARAGGQCFVTGEARFHTCLEAQARGIGLILAGHFASERFAMERLAELLTEQFSDATVWASRAERDPIQWL
jgi:dinuclear metal center YbgI/SA1388 family protein